jgi:serine/threonine protein kinase
MMVLKILPIELAKDLTFSERYAREVHALAKLNHTNIVQCYDCG